jgi:hypothetical protein
LAEINPETATSKPEETEFCDICQANQEIVRKLMAEYIPDELLYMSLYLLTDIMY